LEVYMTSLIYQIANQSSPLLLIPQMTSILKMKRIRGIIYHQIRTIQTMI